MELFSSLKKNTKAKIIIKKNIRTFVFYIIFIHLFIHLFTCFVYVSYILFFIDCYVIGC